MTQDPLTRYACEVTAVPGLLHIMGEITSNAVVDYEQIARNTIREIGYDRDEYGFNADSVEVRCDLHAQSPDIAQGVRQAEELGAGDQGIRFGCV